MTSIFRRKEEDEKLNASGIHVEWRTVDVRTKDPKGIDGLPGPGTNTALRDFQQEHDLPTSNVIDEQLLSFMKEKIEALDKTE